MEKLFFNTRFLYQILLLPICFLTAGCGSDSEDDFTVEPERLIISADLYGPPPPLKGFIIKAEKENVELPVIYFDPDVITRVDIVNVRRSIISAVVEAVDQQTLGVGEFNSKIEIISSEEHQAVDVTYAISDPTINLQAAKRVDTISPHTALSTQSGDFIIRGKGFSSLNKNESISLTIGDRVITDATFIDDTEIRVTLPPLEAGVYEINFSETTGEYEINASLTLIDPITLDTTTINTEEHNGKVIYDDKRRSVYIIKNLVNEGSVERHTYIEGWGWEYDSLYAYKGFRIYNAAIAQDGDTLVMISSEGYVEFDLTDSRPSPRFTGRVPVYIPFFGDKLSMCNSGRVISSGNNDTTLIHYNLFTKLIHIDSRFGIQYLNNPTLLSHENGSKIVIKESEGAFYTFDCNSNELANIAPSPDGSSLFSTRDQSVFLIAGKDIYNESFKYVSSLPESHSYAVFSPDNTMMYAYSDTDKTLIQYNISNIYSPAKIGQLSIDADDREGYHMTISIDGNTLFLITYDKLHIFNLAATEFTNP
ncbi:MAG: IPT/TIG domain-containing protein [Candidatus Thiodiazotropha taylori]|nr:IPT/TIG domain-containing protein [Candidatus Thiodiazotropha endolucinida]MCW4229650.1 IPT/TIG domain-containing protein [Candidatus Thiodiazotropha taylori]